MYLCVRDRVGACVCTCVRVSGIKMSCTYSYIIKIDIEVDKGKLISLQAICNAIQLHRKHTIDFLLEQFHVSL